jgi:hypothetical protein
VCTWRFVYVVLPNFTNASEGSCKLLSPARVPTGSGKNKFIIASTRDDMIEDFPVKVMEGDHSVVGIR